MIMGKDLVAAIEKLNKVMEENEKYLTELDAAIGDGDHGINMKRGFNKVLEELENSGDASYGQILKQVARGLISNVGGASGPLYGTAFMNAARVIDDRDITPELLLEAGESVIEGIQKRGGAEQGDKTMLDAIIPAVETLKDGQEGEKDLDQILEECVKKAEEGMKATIPLVARKGRARYLGERSKGHQDPGATSSFLIIKTLIEELHQENR